MANLRSIKIFQAGPRAAFQPDPAGVQAGDRIHWNNTTDNDHQVGMTDGTFQTDVIPAGSVSNPGYIVSGDIAYRCLIHPQEQGTIHVVPTVVMAPAIMPAAAVMAVAAAAPAKKKGAKKKGGGKQGG